MKNSSLRLVSKLHLRSPRSQSPHCLSSGWTRAAGGRWSPQFSREKGPTRAELSQRKRLTMNALHSLDNRARVLFVQRISRVCHWCQKRWHGSAHLLKCLKKLTLQKQSPLKKKKWWRVPQAPFYARRCSFAYVIGFHLPMSSALCVFIPASETGHAEGVPIAPSRGRSVEFPLEGNHIFLLEDKTTIVLVFILF